MKEARTRRAWMGPVCAGLWNQSETVVVEPSVPVICTWPDSPRCVTLVRKICTDCTPGTVSAAVSQSALTRAMLGVWPRMSYNQRMPSVVS